MDRIAAFPPFTPGQRAIPAAQLNAIQDVAQRLQRGGSISPGEPQAFVKLKADIAADAAGAVVQVYWTGAAYAETGRQFDAWNIGPMDAKTDAIVPLSFADELQPFFSWHGYGTPTGDHSTGGSGGGGTFVPGVASGNLPVSTEWIDTDIGLSASAKAFLLGVFVDTSGGLLDFATYTSRDAEGGPFYIRVNDGYNCIVAPVSGHASGGRVLTRLIGAEYGIITWTCLGYWT